MKFRNILFGLLALLVTLTGTAYTLITPTWVIDVPTNQKVTQNIPCNQLSNANCLVQIIHGPTGMPGVAVVYLDAACTFPVKDNTGIVYVPVTPIIVSH